MRKDGGTLPLAFDDLSGAAINATIHRPALPRRTQAVHEHSKSARVTELRKLGNRAARVLLWLKDHGQHTDRQVMQGLGFSDMNAVRPRITELIDAGLLREVGEQVDPRTHKRVRIVEAITQGAIRA